MVLFRSFFYWKLSIKKINEINYDKIYWFISIYVVRPDSLKRVSKNWESHLLVEQFSICWFPYDDVKQNLKSILKFNATNLTAADNIVGSHTPKRYLKLLISRIYVHYFFWHLEKIFFLSFLPKFVDKSFNRTFLRIEIGSDSKSKHKCLSLENSSRV